MAESTSKPLWAVVSGEECSIEAASLHFTLCPFQSWGKSFPRWACAEIIESCTLHCFSSLCFVSPFAFECFDSFPSPDIHPPKPSKPYPTQDSQNEGWGVGFAVFNSPLCQGWSICTQMCSVKHRGDSAAVYQPGSTSLLQEDMEPAQACCQRGGCCSLGKSGLMDVGQGFHTSRGAVCQTCCLAWSVTQSAPIRWASGFSPLED